MIKLNENSYVVAIVYVSGPFPFGVSKGDFMMCLQKGPDGKYFADYRFRYYKDAEIFDSDDTKNWYKLSDQDGKYKTDEEFLDSITKSGVMDTLKMMGSVEIVRVHGDGRRAGKLLQEQTWGHAKELEDGSDTF